MRLAIHVVCVAGLYFGFTFAAYAEELAFPGAFGFGAKATGWRNGEVLYVSTLDDAGQGSLRECVERHTPRICIFSVSGTIDLDSELKVGPHVYIAGQTAPGQGIQLRLRNGFRSPILLKDTNDVVLRFLKVRPGPGVRPTPSVDAITIENSSRIYVDHVSLMFATDELLNVHVSGGVSADITVANSILAYGLEKANHPQGRHSKGALICSHEKGGNQCGRITIARNLFANNRDRNPDLKATELGPIEVINNIFYNFGSQNGEFYNFLGDLSVNYIGNVAISGPDTLQPTPAMIETIILEGENELSIFAYDNQATACTSDANHSVFDIAPGTSLLHAPAAAIASPILPSSTTVEIVLGDAGDRIGGMRSPDTLDELVVSQVGQCQGHIIDAVEDVGGWTVLKAATHHEDRDRDGLPDSWEIEYPWLNPDEPDDSREQMPGSNYSNIEFYLAKRAGDL